MHNKDINNKLILSSEPYLQVKGKRSGIVQYMVNKIKGRKTKGPQSTPC